jgi:CobQ-like glutamine amidotransferase family enzyme
MNTYGDRGNMITLVRRAEWHGLTPAVLYHHPKQPLPTDVDLLFGGGGQDSAQSDIQEDILLIGDELKSMAVNDVPMLMICGMYQLFGNTFVTHQKDIIQGVSIFDIETRATKHRLIGNLAVETKEFGILYGFENHSGQTYLGAHQPALGSVKRGNGNNDRDKTEGARVHNVVGTYMHGPILPLNPALADWLITTAARRIHPDFVPNHPDDSLVDLARKGAKSWGY